MTAAVAIHAYDQEGKFRPVDSAVARRGHSKLCKKNVSFGDPPKPITVKWVTITPDGAALTSLRRSTRRPPHHMVTPTPSEVDMRHTTISGHQVAHQMVAALWIIAGIIAVIVVGDAFTLLALAIVTTTWWILSAVEHRVESVGSRANH